MRPVIPIFVCCVAQCFAWTWLKSPEARGLGLEPGPLVRATKGEVWPKPQQKIIFDRTMRIDSKTFTFEVTGNTCFIIDDAIARYNSTIRIIRKQLRKARKTWPKNFPTEEITQNEVQIETLTKLEVNLTAPCEFMPYLNMDETYILRVNSLDLINGAELKSDSVWGILRGLETFNQLMYPADRGTDLIIQGTYIVDYPRFPYRGLHLDTARHFIPLRVIFTLLEGMTINKFNVFHWHLVDDQSFPYESTTWPELSRQGAFSPLHIYSQADVAQVIEFARVRGIRVIPEFDTPGHTRSWGIAYPDLLTPCYDKEGLPDGSLGPIHPLRNNTYTFINALLQEIVQVFPDKYLHLGGDEVPFDCWLSNPELLNYMEENNVGPEKLEEIYIQQIIDQTDSLGTIPIVWQEVFDNGVRIPQNTVVHVWKDWTDYMGEIANVTHSGYAAILSSCWYLDHLSSGGDWRKFYNCDPTFFPGSAEAHRRVLGGSACMWSEVADATNVLTRVWPRAAAAAEKLWSAATTDDVVEAEKRLEEHSCRMNMRGVPSQPPNGPGFCPLQLYT